MGELLGVQAEGLKVLAKDLRRLKLDKPLKIRLKTVGEIVATAWRAKESWSSRIPGTIKTGVTQKGVYVRGGGAKAPHLAPNETSKGTFRHPVYGNRDVWVAQQARPGGLAALEENLAAVDDAAFKAIDDWAREAGFR